MPDPVYILSGATLLQAVVFATFLATIRGSKPLAQWLLLALMLVFVLEKADQLFRLSGMTAQHPRWAMIGNTVGTLIAPLIYLHVRERTLRTDRLERRDLLLATPFLALLIYVIATYHILPFDQKRTLFVEGTIATPVNRFGIPVLINLSNLCFLVAAVHRLNRHARGAAFWFSNLDGRVYPGVRAALILMALIIVFHLLAVFLPQLEFRLALGFGHFLLVNVFALSVLQAGDLAKPPESHDLTETTHERPDSLFSEEEIDAVMEAKALHLDPGLTLANLADALNCRPRDLSESLNHGAGRNFYAYVNAWRIREAKKRLLEEPERSVMEIALESGFNSKSAFHNAFRRELGITPTDWRGREQK